MIDDVRLRELLRYDQDTGVFTWLVGASNRRVAGSPAGTKDRKGYIQIGLDGGQYKAHRLAWLCVYGEWPENDIDHINGVPDDNRIANLRLATRSENMQNMRRERSDNKAGFLGVCRDRTRWKATIRIAGKQKHLGNFDTPEEAHAAYLTAKAIHHPFQTLVKE